VIAGLESVQLWRIDPANDTAMASIADILVKPGVVIEDLKIKFSWAFESEFFSSTQEKDLTGPHWSNFSRLAHAIGDNTTLEKLVIEFDYLYDADTGEPYNCTKLDDFLNLIASKVGENPCSALKIFEATSVPDAFHVKAFVKLLETNYTLLKVEIESDDGDWDYDFDSTGKDQLKMYLHLNQHGRKRLMENPNAIPLKEWADVFAKLDDTRCVNYYLTRFPWVMQSPGLSMEDDSDEGGY